MSDQPRTCVVWIDGTHSVTTSGRSVKEVVVKAIEFFNLDFWVGPKPKTDSVYTVALIGDERRWTVKGGKIERI